MASLEGVILLPPASRVVVPLARGSFLGGKVISPDPLPATILNHFYPAGFVAEALDPPDNRLLSCIAAMLDAHSFTDDGKTAAVTDLNGGWLAVFLVPVVDDFIYVQPLRLDLLCQQCCLGRFGLVFFLLRELIVAVRAYPEACKD